MKYLISILLIILIATITITAKNSGKNNTSFAK